jgi:hypothetical protein
MGRFTIKLHDVKFNRDYYLEWTTICDAPVTGGMSLEEYRAYYRRMYGQNGMNNFDHHIETVENHRPDQIEDIIDGNHAGENGEKLTLEEILELYCRNEEGIWLEDVLQSIGWVELHNDTLKRLVYFRDAIRENFTQEQITNKELDECLALSFGCYGEGEVYNIYSQAIQLLKRANNEILIDLYYPENAELDFTLADAFKGFMSAFKDTIPDVYAVMKPKVFINLFIEYFYALHIKGGHL